VAEHSDDQLTLPKTDAGWLFRMEMFATNAILGYWWVLVIGVVLTLASVAVYGFWDSQRVATQRNVAAEVEQVRHRLEGAVLDRQKFEAFRTERGVRMVWSPGFEDQEYAIPPVVRIPLEDALREFGREGVDAAPVLVEHGDALLKIAQAHRGSTQGAHAALFAAELYRIADQQDSRRKALELAAAHRSGAIKFSAESALAHAALTEGDLATAETLLRPWIAQNKGVFGQRAALELARAYRSHDRAGDAIATLQEIKQLWPATAYIDEVDDELEVLQELTGQPSSPPPDVQPTGDDE
jgi:predicted negative regulator of RcsB-dependent stress response